MLKNGTWAAMRYFLASYNVSVVRNRCIGLTPLRSQTTSSPARSEIEEAKPFFAIPRENGVPYYGTFLKERKRFISAPQQIALDRIEKHGKIWREQAFPGRTFDAVYTVNHEDVEKMYRVDGRTPQKQSIPGLQPIRETSGGMEGELGLIFS